ncbi:MAG: thioredoxin [Candidatus Dormibacteraceae bacterium]
MVEVVTPVTDEEFDAVVLKSDKPVLVDFWATWCSPCKMIAPVVEEIAGELGEKVKVVKMDVDQNPRIPGGLGIMSIPTLIIFKGGQAQDRTVGFRSGLKGDLKTKLEGLL